MNVCEGARITLYIGQHVYNILVIIRVRSGKENGKDREDRKGKGKEREIQSRQLV